MVWFVRFCRVYSFHDNSRNVACKPEKQSMASKESSKNKGQSREDYFGKLFGRLSLLLQEAIRTFQSGSANSVTEHGRPQHSVPEEKKT